MDNTGVHILTTHIIAWITRAWPIKIAYFPP